MPRTVSTLLAAAFVACPSALAGPTDSCAFDGAWKIGSTGFDVAFGVDVNSSREIVVGGAYSGPATFAPGVTRAVAGLEDLFIAKYGPNGALLWLATTGGADLDGTFDVAHTPDGGAVACGYFLQTVPFGSQTLISGGSLDAWVAKLDSQGAFSWARRIGGPNVEEARGVAVGPDGSVVVAGYFNTTTTFAPGVTRTSAGNADVYLAKFDADGQFQWVASAGGTNFDSAEGVTTDADGNIFVVGRFQGTAAFAPGVSVVSVGSSDVFLAKYDPAGTLLWVRNAGSTGTDRGTGVGVDSDGNAYITGFFRNSITFGATTLTAQNNDDMFLVKYDPEGEVVWAQRAGTTLNFVQGLALDTNSRGETAVSGYFGGTAVIGDPAFGASTSLTSAGAFDAFVATFDRDGKLLCAVRGGAGGFAGDYSYGVAINEEGARAATGEFGGTATFGDVTFSSSGNQDIWVASLPPFAAASIPGDLNGDGVVNFADLNIVLSNFGNTGEPGAVPGDANDDGVVNFADLNVVLTNFGQSR